MEDRRDFLKLFTMLMAGGAVIPEGIEAAQATMGNGIKLEPPIRTNILKREEIKGSAFEATYLETECVGANNAKYVFETISTKTGDTTTMHMSVAGHADASDPVPTDTSEYSMTLHAKPVDEKHVELSGNYLRDGKLHHFGPVVAVRRGNLPVNPSNDELIEHINQKIQGRKP